MPPGRERLAPFPHQGKDERVKRAESSLVPTGYVKTGTPDEYRGECPHCHHHNKKAYWNVRKQVGECKHCKETLRRSSWDDQDRNHSRTWGQTSTKSVIRVEREVRPSQRRLGLDYQGTRFYITPDSLAARYLAHRGVSVEETRTLGLRMAYRDRTRATVTIWFGKEARRVVRSYLGDSGDRRTLHRVSQATMEWKHDGEFEYRSEFPRGKHADPWILGSRRALEANQVPAGEVPGYVPRSGKEYPSLLVLVEGQFDAIRCWRAGATVACMFGKPSLRSCCEVVRSYEEGRRPYDRLRLALLLDADAAAEALRLHHELLRHGFRSVNLTPELVKLGKKDPDECTEEEIRGIIDDPA